MLKINNLASPYYLLLLILIPIYLWYQYKYKKKMIPVILFSDLNHLKNIKHSFKSKYAKIILITLRCLAITFFIISLARPRLGNKIVENVTNAIDILLTIDLSGSMQAIDFKPNRLEAAKKQAINFIKYRKYDRIGLVVFGKGAYLKCPLTTDYNTLTTFIKNLNFNFSWQNYRGIDYYKATSDFHNATYIATAIGVSVFHLKHSKAKSKVVIFLTDGKQEGDSYNPIISAKLAATYGIKIYTIGIGTGKPTKIPIFFKHMGTRYQNFGSYFDPDTLKQIANITNAEYFHAENISKLKEIYKKIDKLEKTKIKVKEYNQWTEKFQIFIAIALLFLFLEFVLSKTIFRILT